MAELEKNALSDFDFNKMSKPGKFLKFEASKPVTVRILTKDPVVQEKEFTAKNGDINLSTKLCFVVWNFTDERAQILSATPKMARTFQRIGNDEDFISLYLLIASADAILMHDIALTNSSFGEFFSSMPNLVLRRCSIRSSVPSVFPANFPNNSEN